MVPIISRPVASRFPRIRIHKHAIQGRAVCPRSSATAKRIAIWSASELDLPTVRKKKIGQHRTVQGNKALADPGRSAKIGITRLGKKGFNPAIGKLDWVTSRLKTGVNRFLGRIDVPRIGVPPRPGITKLILLTGIGSRVRDSRKRERIGA